MMESQGNSNVTEVRSRSLKAVESSSCFVVLYLDKKPNGNFGLRSEACIEGATTLEFLALIKLHTRSANDLWNLYDEHMDNKVKK